MKLNIKLISVIHTLTYNGTNWSSKSIQNIQYRSNWKRMIQSVLYTYIVVKFDKWTVEKQAQCHLWCIIWFLFQTTTHHQLQNWTSLNNMSIQTPNSSRIVMKIVIKWNSIFIVNVTLKKGWKFHTKYYFIDYHKMKKIACTSQVL